MRKLSKLSLFHENHIKGTEKESYVEDRVLHLANLSAALTKARLFTSTPVYITTRSLKHMYDKRTAEEFDFLLVNLNKIVQMPDTVYRNLSGKRGDLCFVKNIRGKDYLCPIEQKDEGSKIVNYAVTAFRITKADYYLKNYSPIWKWEGGYLHRTDLDTS